MSLYFSGIKKNQVIATVAAMAAMVGGGAASASASTASPAAGNTKIIQTAPVASIQPLKALETAKNVTETSFTELKYELTGKDKHVPQFYTNKYHLILNGMLVGVCGFLGVALGLTGALMLKDKIQDKIKDKNQKG